MILIDNYLNESRNNSNSSMKYTGFDDYELNESFIKDLGKKILDTIERFIRWCKEKFRAFTSYVKDTIRNIKGSKKGIVGSNNFNTVQFEEVQVTAPTMDLNSNFDVYSKITFSQFHNKLDQLNHDFEQLIASIDNCNTYDDLIDFSNNNEIFSPEKASVDINNAIQSNYFDDEINFHAVFDEKLGYVSNKMNYTIDEDIKDKCEKYEEVFELYQNISEEILRTKGPVLANKIKNYIKNNKDNSKGSEFMNLKNQIIYKFLTGVTKFNSLAESACVTLIHKLQSVFVPILRYV